MSAIRTPAHAGGDPSAYADPESPSTGQQSSDESGSSDGVLVELPGNPDQESRGLRRDRDSGILVNIDGSMQEPPDDGDRGDDAGKEETFEDASDELGVVGSRSGGLEESMAVIDIGESSGGRLAASDLARIQARLEDTMVECRKYKEEREVFGREVVSLRQQLHDMINEQALLAADNAELAEHLRRLERGEHEEEKVLSSPTPLHRMLGDCSNSLHHLKGILSEQLNSDNTMRELRSVLYAKDQEIEDLNMKASESLMSRDVILSYMDSLREVWSESSKESSDAIYNRLLASLSSVIGQEHDSLEDSASDGISLVEKKTLLLIEKHMQFLSEIQQLGQCLAEVKPDFANSQENESGIVFNGTREELFESKRKEAYFQERMVKLAEENGKLAEEVKKMKESLEEANAKMGKTKMELEQTDNRLVATREKLSIAVTKGKSLVQQRDSLKQSLAERTAELERCMLELQQKSDALQASEDGANELKQLLGEKTSELEGWMLEFKQKSDALQDALQASEDSANGLRQSIAEKTSELEGCRQELQQKSDALQAAEASVDELKQLLAEKTSDLERSVQDLQQKSVVLQSTEATADGLKQLLAEKTSELENCLAELLQKSDTLLITEATAEELKQLLANKTSELERCFEESQQKSDALEIAKASTEELNETHGLVNSLRESLSQRDMVLREIEEIMSADSTQELHSMEAIDRVRWFVNQKKIADVIFLENRKAKDALSLIELPETMSSSDLDSQIIWLVNSFTQAKDDIIQLQEEIARTQLAVASHESEFSETHKEIDHLTKSILEEKQAKESLQNKHEDLRCKYEGIAEQLSIVSSEKDRLMKVLLEVSESSIDDQPSVDINVMIDKCLAKIRERIKTSIADSEQIERMQSLLYVSSQELKLREMILEEDLIDKSNMMRLSDELRRVSEELAVLRNDKESLQKELAQAEEKYSLVREKLSMAVKKGKGLVQEREGFKHSLDEKNSEIEKLKYDLQLKDSAINDYQGQMKSLSALPEHIQKLESDIASLKEQRDQSEQILHKSNGTLQRLVDSVENIILPTDNIFEGPVEKLNWFSEHVKELQVAKAHVEQELDKVKGEATWHSSMFADASATIKSLEDRLADAEKHISFITDEKKDMQLGRASIEQELEKMKEEGSMQANKLAGAYSTIKSLEDALSQAERDISRLDAEKIEAESKSKEEIKALNAKLAECMEELAGAHSSLENYSAQLNSHLGHLQMFMKDEGLLSFMTEEFRKKVESLRSMGLIIHNMHEQFAEKGLYLHPEHDHEFAKLLSLPKFEDFLNDKILHNVTSTPELDDVPSLTSIVEGLHAQAKLLSVRFRSFSKHMDDHVALVLQGLQATRDEFIHMLDLRESLKSDLVKLEANNQAQDGKIVSLQKEVTALFSACMDATQELQIELHHLMNLDSSTEQGIMNSSLDSRSREAVSDGVEEGYAVKYAKAADDLLHAARRVKIQCQQLANIKEVCVTSIDDLKDKLKQAELTAETSVQDQHLYHERVSALERELKALQESCSEMNSKIENYQAREGMLRNKEEELLSLQHTLTAKERGIADQLFSQDQMETLIHKINNIEIPLSESETQYQNVQFSSPIDKLFYVVDKVSELLHRLDTLTDENKDMRLILASRVQEVEQLKKAAEAMDTNYQELESKRSELFELTVGLEKIIQKLGGTDSIEDQKPKAKALVTALERLTIASSMESENSKSRILELVAKLQAKEKVVVELTTKIKMLEESIHSRLAQPDNVKERTVFEASPSAIGSEISEIEDTGPIGKNSISAASTAAHVRTMRKGSNDHLVLNIDSESDRLIAAQETDDKGHVFKSLNTSGLIPKQGKLIADRVDGIWVSGGRILMSRPGARLVLIAYWMVLHLWLLGTIL